MKKSLAMLSEDEIKNILKTEFKQPTFRAKQILSWIYKGVSISNMNNLPKNLREQLEESYSTSSLEIVKTFVEKKSGTTKFLLKTQDEIYIECVLLEYDKKYTVCVSSQAGCNMGCVFCESGKDGLLRDLSAEEMVAELICVRSVIDSDISNIVLMGSGEPFDNYDATMDFVRFINQEDTFNIGIRHITVSTCGVLSGIRRLIEEGPYINLAVSLHSPISEIRRSMMPVEKAYPIDKVVALCNEYREKAKRRITYEYCLVEGVNDNVECANALAKLLAKTDSHVNLINVNDGGKYKENKSSNIEVFAKMLEERKINCTIRRKLGSSINAACGQLQAKYNRDK